MHFIDRNSVFALLPIEACMQVMAEAFSKLHKNISIQYLSKSITLPGENYLSLMPVFYDEVYFGAKVITVYPQNLGGRLSTLQGSVLLFNSQNGEMLACIDAGAITQLRTAAVSALATHMLAREDASRAAFIGAGTQARSHLASLRLVRPITSICVYDINEGYAQSFAEQARAKYDIEAAVACSAAEAVRYADIVCTMTTSATPLLYKADIMPGAHINAIGACLPNMRELSTDLISVSRFFGDNKESIFCESGDFIIPLSEKAIGKGHFLGDLPQILFDNIPGRVSGTDITVFKSLGIAIEDIAAAKYVYEQLLLQSA